MPEQPLNTTEDPVTTDKDAPITVETIGIGIDELAGKNLGEGSAQNTSEPPPPQFSEPQPQIKDNKGQTFDPNIHQSNPDGTPKVNKFGNFYKKIPGRPSSNPNSSSSDPGNPSFNVPPGGSAGTQPGGMNDAQFEALSETILVLGNGIMVALLSDEIANTPDEHKALKMSLTPWLKSGDIKEVHPGVMFGMVALGLYLPKFGRPTVRQRLRFLSMKVRIAFENMLGRIFNRNAKKKVVEVDKQGNAQETVEFDESDIS